MRLACDLIIADQPTVNGRVYSKEAMEKIHAEMKSTMDNGQLFIYHAMEDYDGTFRHPGIEKIAGQVVGCKLSDRFEFEIERMDTPISKIIDFTQPNLQPIPVIWGDVRKNEETGYNEVHNVSFSYLNLGIKGKDYRNKSEVE
jgi:hypothetical protein